MEISGLNCRNCKAEVPPDKAHFWGRDATNNVAAVFICETCFILAERFYARGRKELMQLLTMHKEGIRVALEDGVFHFGSDKDQDVSKTDLLRAIVKMEETRRATLARASHADPGRPPQSRALPSTGLVPGRTRGGPERKG